jgi:hypothetical protein
MQPVASTQFSYSSGFRVKFAAIQLLDLDSSPEQRLRSSADAQEQLDNHQSFLLRCRHRENINQARIKQPQMSVRLRSPWLFRHADRQRLFGPIHQGSELWGELAAMCAQTELSASCRKPVTRAVKGKRKLYCASSVDNFNHLS